MILLLARLMGQYCIARWRLSSSVTLPACGPGAWAVGRPPCTAGQYGDTLFDVIKVQLLYVYWKLVRFCGNLQSHERYWPIYDSMIG